MLKKSSVLSAILTGILVLTSAAHGQGLLTTHITRLGNENPFSLFRTTNGTVGPITDTATGVYSEFFISADYGLLTVNSTAVMPANVTDQSTSTNAYARWTDTYNFAPVNSSLSGTIATARFSLSLIGNWTHSFDAGASATSISYNIHINGGDVALGSYNTFSGGSGNLDLGDFSSFTYDQPFTIGTPFTMEFFLSDGNALHDTQTGPSSASAYLTLASTGLQILDNTTALIAGTMSTDSGHDYSISSVPEPAAWALTPLLIGAMAMWRRRRS